MTQNQIAKSLWVGDDQFNGSDYDCIIDLRDWDAERTFAEEDYQYIDGIINDIKIGLTHGKTLVHCVLPKTIISTLHPSKIEDVSGYVFTHDGTQKQIIRKFVRKYKGKIYQIDPRGILPISFTPEHPLLVFRPYKEPRGKKYKPTWNYKSEPFKEWNKTQPHWVKAKDLELGDFLLSPTKLEWGEHDVPQYEGLKNLHKNTVIPNPIIMDKEMAWFFGFYIADGGTCGQYQISLTLSLKDDLQRITNAIRRLGFEPKIKVHENYKIVKVNSKILVQSFKKWFGNNAKIKQIPSFLLTDSVIDEVLDGIFCGDGSLDKGARIIDTVSEQLAYQIWHVLNHRRLYPYLRKVKPENRTKGSYPTANILYRIEWNPKATQHYTCYWDDYYLMQIMDIKGMNYEGIVHNLEIEENNTYLTNGVITHNCHGGMDRSPFVVAMYLHIHHQLPPFEAYDAVQKRRKQTIIHGEWLFPYLEYLGADTEFMKMLKSCRRAR